MADVFLSPNLRKELVDQFCGFLEVIASETYSEKLTITELMFIEVAKGVSKISVPYKYLADSYVKLYEYIKSEKGRIEHARNS